MIGGSTQDRILGNRIGLGVDGVTLLPNGRDGILVDSSPSNDIGLGPGGVLAGNTIAGNGQDGLALTGGSDANQVVGNLIGTTSDGTVARPNLRNGIFIDGSNNNNLGIPGQVIASGAAGGVMPSNLISGNDAAGIEIDSATGNQIYGDYIGTTLDGEGRIGNGVAGVFLNQRRAIPSVGPHPVSATSSRISRPREVRGPSSLAFRFLVRMPVAM